MDIKGQASILDACPFILVLYFDNVPLAEQDSNAICIAGNIVDRQPQNGGNGLGCQDDLAYTLTATDRLSGYPDK